MKIYYVEDDAGIRELVCYTLNQTGYDARGFADGETFQTALDKGDRPDLLLLDIMLPGNDGLALLKCYRARENQGHIPVIIISAKDSEFDKVKGLDLGADDYVTKPFGMMELLARIKAVLRRAPRTADAPETVIAGEVVLDMKRRTVVACGASINLTYKEFELLSYLMLNRGIVLSREKLLSAVWDYDYFGGTRTVDVHVQTLRQKLGMHKDLIQTVRGIGYRVSG